LCDKINVDEIGVACETYGKDEKCIQVLAGTHQGKQHLGKRKHSLEDSIQMDLKEISVN
jgi:hypothetical protein